MATIELTPSTGSSKPPLPPQNLAFPAWEDDWRDQLHPSSPELEQEQGELWRAFEDLAEDLGVSDEQMKVVVELTEQMNKAHQPLARHSLNVGFLAVEAADFLGVDRRKALLGGELHDTGKMTVDPKTLKKTTKYSFADFREMNKHSKAGHDILSGYNVLPEELPLVVGTHHKRQLNNANGMDEKELTIEACRLRDAIPIADFIDSSFRSDGHADDISSNNQKARILEHISYVLDQDIYNNVENKAVLAEGIMNTLLDTRVSLENLSELAYAY